MARVAVTYTDLTANTSTTVATGTTLDATNDHTLASADPERTVLYITNTDGAADHTFTVVAGDNPPAIASGQGNISITVPATGAVYAGPFDSSIVLQNDGSMEFNVEASHTGVVAAYRVPRNC